MIEKKKMIKKKKINLIEQKIKKIKKEKKKID
jgi:hypothetical protein